MNETVVEVRCPIGPQRLFTKLRLGQETARMVPGNLLEFSCADCGKTLTRLRGGRWQVFHRYNFLGDLVSTTAEQREDAATSREKDHPM